MNRRRRLIWRTIFAGIMGAFGVAAALLEGDRRRAARHAARTDSSVSYWNAWLETELRELERADRVFRIMQGLLIAAGCFVTAVWLLALFGVLE